MTQITVNEAIVDFLERQGSRYIFGVPNPHLFGPLYKREGVKPVLVRHEQAAVFMACGYGLATGSPGICTGTLGPGWGNLLSGLGEATLGSMPLLAICPGPSVTGNGRGVMQEFEQMKATEPFCKWTWRLQDPKRIYWAMRRAFAKAITSPPGPVYLEIPLDVGVAKVDRETGELLEPRRSEGNPADIAKAVQLILAAEAPLLVAGSGVHRSRAYEQLKALASLLDCPVLTTPGGKGSIEDTHPLAAGCVGVARTKWSREIYEAADLQIWVGSQLEGLQTADWKWRPPQLVHIDVDVNQIGRNWRPDCGIVGDARLVLSQLIEALAPHRNEIPERATAGSLSRLRERYIAESQDILNSTNRPIHPGKSVWEISKQVDESTFVVQDVGAHMQWVAASPYMEIKQAGNWAAPSDYLCLGFGVAAALGVKLARPEMRVISICGDGGFQMVGLHEMAVASEYRIPVTWVIINNGALGWIKYEQKRIYAGQYVASEFHQKLDFVKAAEAAGCFGLKVIDPGSLQETVKKALEMNEKGVPVVVDVDSDPGPQLEGFDDWYDAVLE